MLTIPDWFPLATVGGTFTAVGLLKIYGFRKGIIGGGGRPVSCRLLGSCPNWSRRLNILFVAFFLGVGLSCLVRLLRLILIGNPAGG